MMPNLGFVEKRGRLVVSGSETGRVATGGGGEETLTIIGRRGGG